MDLHEQKILFEQLVTSKIVQTEYGMIVLPVKGMQEFHDKMGFAENELCFFSLRLPECEDGLYNYYMGNFLADDVKFEIIEAFYYDTKTGESEEFAFGNVLVDSFRRSLLAAEAMFCGDIMVDNRGRAFVAFMISDDIGVRAILTFKPKTLGIPIFLEDSAKTARLWFNGEEFYYSPTTFFYVDGNYLPS